LGFELVSNGITFAHSLTNSGKYIQKFLGGQIKEFTQITQDT